jgi:hypothetical protein
LEGKILALFKTGCDHMIAFHTLYLRVSSRVGLGSECSRRKYLRARSWAGRSMQEEEAGPL